MILKQTKNLVHKEFLLKLVAFGVLANGLLITLNSLVSHVILRRHIWRSTFELTFSLAVGLTLIYLSTLLARRKHTAWIVTLAVYTFSLGATTSTLIARGFNHDIPLLVLVRAIALPLFLVSALLLYRKEFTVRSDIKSFALTMRSIFLILSIALLYGTIGFTLMDQRDFRREISVSQAAYYTIDEFNIFTPHAVTPHTERSRVFLDSLGFVGGISMLYASISLFQPLRARFRDETEHRERMLKLLQNNSASSEDFFKLWPHDKTYLFSSNSDAGLAYHVTNGVAMSVGDPVGTEQGVHSLMGSYLQECAINDWIPTFIHTEPKHTPLYKFFKFSLQKIGEEAVVTIDSFLQTTAKEKYFRQISNKFTKQHFETEMLHPPHSAALIGRLKTVSDDWLGQPGRSERGFMMGYFSEEYMQQCPLMVLRDDAGTIQAFVNQIPSFDPEEANYDLLRQSRSAPGNSTDFLMMGFMAELHKHGYKRLNLGLCPLSGLDADDTEQNGAADSLLSFVYNNGDRLYSFSGLRRYKEKYNPTWSSRYIAYRGGARGLARTARALTKAMKR
ncbi:MAG: phosphatidylglycerol lysyltransferase domain-containing protein [Candidatus Saccharibacteria bacterium]|nr:phosphatidylglycerol lysyltransferase domain-containing protein [Candidatus Saccharibacteria bacterium]